MKDIFQNSSSNWVRYNKYEWRTSADGKCYITPAADAKPSIYNPIKDYEKLVLTAINIGTTSSLSIRLISARKTSNPAGVQTARR